MSVINKMLRDLDQRQTPGAPGTTGVQAAQPDTWHQGVHSLPVPTGGGGATPPSRAARFARLGLGGAVLAGVGLAGWLLWQRVEVAVPAAASGAAALAAVAPVPVPAVSFPQAGAPPVVPVSAPLAVNRTEPAPPDRAPPALARTPASVGRPGDTANPGTSAAVSLRMESALLAPQPLRAASPTVTEPLAPPVAAPKASPVQSEPPSATQRQQQASADVVLQAQTLWSAGSHAAAMEVLQQSVDAAERAARAGTTPAGNPALLSLVRELVRMQMAQSQYAVVWDLLVRLEPVLGNQPDLWGLRGNTGQRLGRHQDSVQAYRAALQSRPQEQRWLLGCAVSLAALGQLTPAAEMADRARSVGPISRDVQSYLQQMGVPLHDK